MPKLAFIRPALAGACFTLCLFGAARPGLAQTQPTWSVNLPAAAQWQHVTLLGNLLVYTGDQLHGIDPATGTVKWSQAMPGLTQAGVTDVAQSPYVRLSATNGNVYLLDPLGGKVLFNANQAGLKEVGHQTILYGSQRLVVQGTLKSGNKGLVLVNMQDGSVAWTYDKDLAKVRTVSELPGGDFLLATLFKLFRFGPANSTPKWEASADPAMDQMGGQMAGLMAAMAKSMGADNMDIKLQVYPSLKPTVRYVGYSSRQQTGEVNGQPQYTDKGGVYALNVETGKPLWAAKYEFEGELPYLINLPQGVVVCPGGTGNTSLNLLDPANGTPQWGKKGKGVKVNGGVVDHAITPQGLLIGSTKESAWTPNTVKLVLDLLDPATGESRFKKQEKVTGTFRMMELLGTNRLLYATTEEANILDLTTGENVLSSISTGPGLVQRDPQNANTLYVMDPKKGELHALDLNAGTERVVNADRLKFDGREDPTRLEVRPNGIFIGSTQNAALLGRDGQLRYHQYVEAPREPGAVRALALAASVLYTYESARSQAASAKLRKAGQEAESELGQVLGQELADGFEQRGNQAMSYAQEAWQLAKARYTATQAGQDHVYMLRNDGGRTTSLVRLNKDTGKLDDVIDLGTDQKPDYALDAVGNRLFYHPSGTKLVGYQF